MDINQLIEIVKKKINSNTQVDTLQILDKTFLHKKHRSYEEGKFHLEIIIKSEKLKNLSRVEATRILNKILEKEIKEFIHSLQIKLI